MMKYEKWLAKNCEYAGRDFSEEKDRLETILADSARFDTMEEWLAFADRYLQAIRNSSKTKKEGVCFSTFHGAKGLEWKHVYIIGANKDICPYKKAVTDADLEEERRMFYVAMTRAKDVLNICYCSKAPKWQLSPYIAESMKE
jgi:DNA helicase-2/ATP-dependent DNA helicase PcrA